MPIYKFIHTQDDWIQTNLTNKSFDNTWFKVEASGKIIIKGSHGNGYAWDGCSPKWKLFGRIIGTPDGKIDPATNRPKTYYASMFHDAIYQHKNAEGMNISRREADAIFKLMLQKANFRSWRLYTIGVRLGGWFYGKWQSKSNQKNIFISSYSWLQDH